MTDLRQAVSDLYGIINEILDEAKDNTLFSDISRQQLMYLNVIAGMDNPTMTELAKELGLTKPTVTVLTDKLAARGYIKKIRSVKDKRSVNISVEEKGKKTGTTRQSVNSKIEKMIMSGLTEDETKTFIMLLQKIISKAGKDISQKNEEKSK